MRSVTQNVCILAKFDGHHYIRSGSLLRLVHISTSRSCAPFRSKGPPEIMTPIDGSSPGICITTHISNNVDGTSIFAPLSSGAIATSMRGASMKSLSIIVPLIADLLCGLRRSRARLGHLARDTSRRPGHQPKASRSQNQYANDFVTVRG